MARHVDHTDPAVWVDELDEPEIDHVRRELTRVEHELAPDTANRVLPQSRRAALEQQRTTLRRALERLELDDHWSSGAGDRTLF